MDRTEYVIVSMAGALAILIIARLLQHKWPIGPNLPHPEVSSDWFVTIINLLLSVPAGLLAIPCSIVVVGWFGGGGLIHVRTDGWHYIPALICFVLVGDLFRYSIHRLQHKVPFLWAMHSFHHSANALTLVTGARHFWLEKLIFGGFLPLFQILFTVPEDMVTIIGLFYFLPDGCAHLNVRFSMGRLITVLNSPQWHRIHHSVQPEHFDKNFAAAFPLWDFVFGTACIPKPDEYPDTGLVPAESVGIFDSMVWPFRFFLRRRLAAFRMDQFNFVRIRR
jgi:sterol desaturase/sphingolipid hydroxylase (fatty acid hydroxylase superfamily)